MKKFLLICLVLSGLDPAFSQNPGDNTFQSSIVHDINITLSQPGFWDSLMYYKQHADSFNLSTQYMMGNIVIDGTQIDSIGVKLKGNSSFGYPGRKKPIKISFNEYVSGQKFDGLKTLNLNNNMLDPTMMREKLMLDFLNKKGLSAPRCTYAKVSYNGQYVGLYKMVEQVDKTFANTHYGNNDGNLFKGDPQGSLIWFGGNPASYYNYYELHTNKTANDWSGLVNLIDNINNTPQVNFNDTLETILNTTPMIKQWAAGNLFVDLDQYFNAPHNYYLYHNTTTNKFEWINWDVSVVFGFYPMMTELQTQSTSIFKSAFPLTNNLLADAAYKAVYLNAICEYLDYFSNTVLDPQIDSIANVIRPHIYAEPDSNKMFPNILFELGMDTFTLVTPMGDIPGLKGFIANRRNYVVSELSALPWFCTNAVNNFLNSDFDVLIYSNPFSNNFTLEFELPNEMRVSVKMYNVLGQEAAELISDDHFEKAGMNQLNVESNKFSLSSGVYFIKFTAEEFSIMIKLVKIEE